MPTPKAGLGKTFRPVVAHDDGMVLIPFSFKINGTSDPLTTTVNGDLFRSVVRNSAGKFTCTLKARPARCFYGEAGVSVVADSTNLLGQVDWSTVKSTGTFVVRTLVAAVQTDPADLSIVGGFLLVSKTSRDGRR